MEEGGLRQAKYTKRQGLWPRQRFTDYRTPRGGQVHWARLSCGPESGLTGPAKMECRAVAAWASPESYPPVTSCFPLLQVLKPCPQPRRRPTLTSRASQFGYQGPKAAATGSRVGWRDHKSRLVSLFYSSFAGSGYSPAPPVRWHIPASCWYSQGLSARHCL